MSIKNLSGMIYTFRSGDSLYTISRRYNTSIAEISRENPLIDIYNLKVGDEIFIPVDFNLKNKVIDYTVLKNDTIQNIMLKFNLDMDELLKYNELDSLKLVDGMHLNIPMVDYAADDH